MRGLLAGLLPILLLALLTSAACGGSRVPGGTLASTPLKLERVVLYRNGVGYFERNGRVQGQELRLKVRKDQINDLLKSLAVVDKSSGKVLGVSIPLDPQGFHKLAIAALAPGHGQLAQVLDALRGTRVRVETATRSADGRIVMVERLEALPGPAPIQPLRYPPQPEPPPSFVDHKLTLLDGERVEVVLLSEIQSLSIEDADVVMQLHRRLDASAGEGMFQQVELTLRLAGKAEHDLVVSYVAPAPLWQPTYRLVLDDAQPGKALLQAWAVVDNTSGETWKDVQLSLTSGAPIAFQYDLHTPREVERPDMTYSAADKRAQVAIGERSYGGEADMASEAAAPAEAPMAQADEEGAMAEESKSALMERSVRVARKAGAASGAAPTMAPMPAAPPPPALTLQALAQSAAASTRAERVAGLTRFDLQDRVTLPDGSATMVALVNQLVQGEQVFLFKPGGSGQGYEHNPYRVVRFRNDTDFVLEPGPISIYASGSFVGEGLSEAISSRDTATIPFAVEPSILVQSKVEYGGEELRTVKLVRGVLEVERYQRVSTEWRVTGPKDQAAFRVLVRHPRQGGSYELVEPKAGVEQLPDAYLVPIELARGVREGSVKVVEQTPVRTTVSIWDGEAEKLLDTLLAATNLDAAMRAKLEPIVQKRRELGRVDTQIAGLEAQREALDQRVAETRESLKAIQKDPRAAALRKRLGERLDGFLKEADAAGRQIVELQSKRLELKIALEDLLERDGAATEPAPPPGKPVKPTR